MKAGNRTRKSLAAALLWTNSTESLAKNA